MTGFWLIAVFASLGAGSTVVPVTFDSALVAEVIFRDPGRDVAFLDPGSTVRA